MHVPINTGTPSPEAVRKLEEMIANAQRRCRVRLINPQMIIDHVKYLDDYLPIPKMHLKGVVAYVDIHADTFSRRYYGIPYSTQFTVRHNGRMWVVLDVYRAPVNGRTRRYRVDHTDASKAALIASHTYFRYI